LLAIYSWELQAIFPNMNHKTYRILLGLYAGLILTLSSIPSKNMPRSFILEWDKVIHFSEYFIFGILAAKSIEHLTVKWVYIIIPLGVIFGIMDEYFQSFISGRFSSGLDALSDSLGFSLAVLLVWLRTNDNKNIH